MTDLSCNALETHLKQLNLWERFLFEREFVFLEDRKWRLDFAVHGPKCQFQSKSKTEKIAKGLRVGIEIDGGQKCYGGGKHGSDDDYTKRNALTLAGWTVLYFTTSQLRNNPALCVETVRSILNKKMRGEL